MIDGVLLREMMVDLLFFFYSVIMVDEVYERSIVIDIFFGFLKKIIRWCFDLCLIVVLVIMDIKVFCDFFDISGEKLLLLNFRELMFNWILVILLVEGRIYLVFVYYSVEFV